MQCKRSVKQLPAVSLNDPSCLQPWYPSCSTDPSFSQPWDPPTIKASSDIKVDHNGQTLKAPVSPFCQRHRRRPSLRPLNQVTPGEKRLNVVPPRANGRVDGGHSLPETPTCIRHYLKAPSWPPLPETITHFHVLLTCFSSGGSFGCLD